MIFYRRRFVQHRPSISKLPHLHFDAVRRGWSPHSGHLSGSYGTQHMAICASRQHHTAHGYLCHSSAPHTTLRHVCTTHVRTVHNSSQLSRTKRHTPFDKCTQILQVTTFQVRCRGGPGGGGGSCRLQRTWSRQAGRQKTGRQAGGTFAWRWWLWLWWWWWGSGKNDSSD